MLPMPAALAGLPAAFWMETLASLYQGRGTLYAAQGMESLR